MGTRFITIALALAGFLAGPLATDAQDLVPCPGDFGPTAMCGFLSVPEDWSDESGRTLEIRVVVLPARNESEAEPLLLFPGGPGQATTDLIDLARGVYPGVQESRDLVFVGQRGSGASNPLHCTRDVEGNPESAFGNLWDPERIRICYQDARKHADPSQYTTDSYVSDIEHALDELGYGKAVLWGGSGGTRTAVALIRRLPERVVGAVLDGITPINYAMPVPFSRFVQESWDHVVEDCAAQAQCHAAHPTLEVDMERVLHQLDGPPTEVVIEDGRGSRHTVPFHRGDFAYAVRGILYNANATATLPMEIHHAAESGDLSYFAQALFDRWAGLGNAIAVGLHLSVYCAEDVPMITSEDIRSTTGTIVGRYLIDQYADACRSWPVEPVTSDWYGTFHSEIPVLLLSGYYDPSTPAEAAESVRVSFPNSAHIVVRNAGHGAGFGCASQVVEAFLLTPSVDDVHDPCVDEPIRFQVRGAR